MTEKEKAILALAKKHDIDPYDMCSDPVIGEHRLLALAAELTTPLEQRLLQSASLVNELRQQIRDLEAENRLLSVQAKGLKAYPVEAHQAGGVPVGYIHEIDLGKQTATVYSPKEFRSWPLGQKEDITPYLPLYATPQPSEDKRDGERLDFLDQNMRFGMSWKVGAAPAGNLSIQSILGIKPPTPIRSAIDAAIAAAAADNQATQNHLRSEYLSSKAKPN